MKNKNMKNHVPFKFSANTAMNLVHMFEDIINESLIVTVDENPALETVRGLIYNYIDQNAVDIIQSYNDDQESNDILMYFCAAVEEEFPVAEGDDKF